MAAVATAVAFLVLFALLAAASVVDIRRREIPNRLVLAVVALWLLWRLAVATGAASVADAAVGMAADVGAALLFGLALLAFVAASERATGRFMMGGGDVKLLAALSLFLGVGGIAVALFAACLASLAFAAARPKRGIPFAPCIMCGALVALLAL